MASMPSLGLALVLFALLAGSLLVAPPAHAIYGPAAGGLGADIVSVDNASDEQANAPTTDAVISADGRYVVFQTRATNFFENDGGVEGPHGTELDAEPPGTLREGGVFRYDRATGEIQLVADGSEVYSEGAAKGMRIFRGAENPSVSADGRYVAFSTAQQLVPHDTNENVDVYVRDMDVPLTPIRMDSGAYTLVSAKSGGEEPATYGVSSQYFPGDQPGAEVWPNTAISADGNYVVFRTGEVTSDLPQGGPDVPPEQLFVRNVREKTTTLVSREAADGMPAGGAVGPASISGDGTAVAWVGTNAPAQTLFLPGESLSASQPYYLWQRWQEGGKTRRITGLSDPEDPACHEEGVTQNPLSSGPCYGPLSEQESSLASITSSAPSMSNDGYTVAFLAGAALRPNITKSAGLDVFVTSMAPHMTRKNSTRELTLGVKSGNPGSTPSIESLAISPDGGTIAFTTLRDSFVLPEPRPIGAFRPVSTVSDLYVIHLAEGTLERTVVGFEGEDPNGSTSASPSLDEHGENIAFTSSASNLIFGDANGASDAFTATLQGPAGNAPPPAGVNAVQDGFVLTAVASPELGLSVKRAKGGELTLLVETPGAGRLAARANGVITTKRGHRKQKKNATLAHALGVVRAEGITTLKLDLASQYVKDLKKAGKLNVLVTVTFTPSAPGEALTAEAGATFIVANVNKGTKASPKAKRKQG
jgi:Tol biopolymer transport system component